MDESESKKIEKRLDQIVILLSKLITENKTKTGAIELLDSLGLENSIIAKVTGSSVNSVKVRKSEKKAKGANK